jgi:polyisoprenoid-binding protein YceI
MATSEAQPGSLPAEQELPGWTFDPARTEASFRSRRMGRTWVNGRFKDVHGKLYLDLDDPRSSSCLGEIDVANLYAGEPYLNTQLRAADFLHAEEHRKITFAARLGAGANGADFTAEVLLTLRGTTRLVVMDVAYLGQWKAPFWIDGANWGTATRMGLRAHGRISGADFAMLVQDEDPSDDSSATAGIEIVLDVEAALDADLQSIGAIIA